MAEDTNKRTASQLASSEMAEAVFADPELRDRFALMAKETATRTPVRDDFAWLAPDARPVSEFSRFKALTQKLLGVSKNEVAAHRHR